MGKKDKRVDAYIAKAQLFAKPILNHLRQLVHEACPNVEETMKWSFPHFDYKGSIMCSMASFKEHLAFGFWKASIMRDTAGIFSSKEAMGHFGRITSLRDLPPDKIMIQYIKEAAKLNDKGVTVVKKAAAVKKELNLPDYFMKALGKNKKALKTFQGFSYTNKKEYIEWINGAKTEETRTSRLAQAVQWMAEGKVRNWKYVKK